MRNLNLLTSGLVLSVCFFLISPMDAFGPSTISSAKKRMTTKKDSFSSRLFVSSADDMSAMPEATIPTPTEKVEEAAPFAKLQKISNFASILCVLDCTILPIVTVFFPLLGIVNIGAERLELLHELGHSIAMFFVLPVGGLTSILNYISHKRKWITSLGAIGLTMIALANSHFFSHLPVVGELEIIHQIHHNHVLHRFVNILGCAFLLGSNYLSQKQGCAHHDHNHSHDGASCSHDHSHGHHDHEH